MKRLRATVLALLGASLLLGCDGRGAGDGNDAVVDADTAGVQPRTAEEIQRQAEPMTPERAAELGVIDTTIQVAEEP